MGSVVVEPQRHTRHVLGDVRMDASSPIASRASQSLADLSSTMAIRMTAPFREITRATTSGLPVIAVVTAGRPVLLKRCLQSLAAAAREWSWSAPVLIIDGSTEADARRRNRVIATATAASTGLKTLYFGPRESTQLVAWLARQTGTDPAVLRVGLELGSAGANRNATLLVAAGHKVVYVDDDVIFQPWRGDSEPSGLRLSGHYDVYDSTFYATREQSVGVVTAHVDLLSLHSNVLGASLSTLYKGASSVDTSSACSHSLAAHQNPDDYRVAVSMAGLAGDSGRDCQFNVLFSSGSVRDLLLKSRASLRLALRSREVRRVARCLTVGVHAECMAYCMGVANEYPLPPFLPFGRNEEGVFTRLISITKPRALFAHIPYGIVHNSSRSARYPPRMIPSATNTRLSEVVELIALRVSAENDRKNDDTIRRFGTCLNELGALDHRELYGIVSTVVRKFRREQLASCRSMLSPKTSAAAEFMHAAERYCDTLSASIKRDTFVLPIEFHTRELHSFEGQVAALSRFCEQFGSFVKLWPDLWHLASTANLK
jgi:hypothetical protein